MSCRLSGVCFKQQQFTECAWSLCFWKPCRCSNCFLSFFLSFFRSFFLSFFLSLHHTHTRRVVRFCLSPSPPKGSWAGGRPIVPCASIQGLHHHGLLCKCPPPFCFAEIPSMLYVLRAAPAPSPNIGDILFNDCICTRGVHVCMFFFSLCVSLLACASWLHNSLTAGFILE